MTQIIYCRDEEKGGAKWGNPAGKVGKVERQRIHPGKWARNEEEHANRPSAGGARCGSLKRRSLTGKSRRRAIKRL